MTVLVYMVSVYREPTIIFWVRQMLFLSIHCVTKIRRHSIERIVCILQNQSLIIFSIGNTDIKIILNDAESCPSQPKRNVFAQS